MWPFRRKVEAPAADGPHPVPAPVIRRDWAGLPPIQRFVGAHPLTAPSDQFSDDLATHQDPSVSTDTMGHQVSADAPPGLVLALARPTTRSDGPAMIPRPRVQRSVAGAVGESGEWDGDEAAPATRPTPLPMSAHPVAARELAVVAPEPVMQRLTSLPPDAQVTPVPPMAQRSRAVPTPLMMSTLTDEPSETPPAPVQRLTLGQSRRLGLGAPIRQVPDHTVQRSVSDAMPMAPSPLPTLPRREPTDASTGTREPMDVSVGEHAPMDVSRVGTVPTDGPMGGNVPIDLPLGGKVPLDLISDVRQKRTSALGAPLAPSLDASDEPRLDLPLAVRPSAAAPGPGDQQLSAPAPSVQLSAISSVEPASDSSMATPPAVQRVAPVEWAMPSLTESPQTLGPANALTAPSPRVATSRLPLATESPARAAAFSALSAPEMAAMAPLVGARPLRPSATLQRSLSTDALTPHPDPPPQGARELPSMRAMDDAPHPDPSPQGARELPLMRTMDDTPYPDPPPQGGRELPLTRAMEDTPHPDPFPQGTREFPAPTLSLPQRGREDGRLPLAPSHGIAVQRASDAAHDTEAESGGAGDEAFGPLVQGAWYEAPVGVSRVSATAISDTSPSVAAPAGPHQASETEVDELAKKLYDRIRTRLKTELLVDRERAGFLTDLR